MLLLLVVVLEFCDLELLVLYVLRVFLEFVDELRVYVGVYPTLALLLFALLLLVLVTELAGVYEVRVARPVVFDDCLVCCIELEALVALDGVPEDTLALLDTVETLFPLVAGVLLVLDPWLEPEE